MAKGWWGVRAKMKKLKSGILGEEGVRFGGADTSDENSDELLGFVEQGRYGVFTAARRWFHSMFSVQC